MADEPKRPITQPSMPSVPRPATGTYSSVGRPEDKETVEFERPPAWAIQLAEKVAELRGETVNGFAFMNAHIETVANDLGVVKDRVKLLEKFRDDAEERTRKHSGGIARISTSDATQNTTLAAISGRLTAVEGQTQSIDDKVVVVAEAVGAVVNELGISGKVALGNTPVKEEASAFERLEKRMRSSTVVAVIIALSVLADAIVRAIHH